MNTSVIILDVGPTMTAIPEDGSDSKLETAVQAIDLFIQNKMFNRPKDEVSLVLIGTDETSNRLSDMDESQYQNITVARDLMLPTLDLVRFVANSIVPGTGKVDVLDAVIVAMDIFVTRCEDFKKPPLKKELFIFSDLEVGFDDPEGQIHEIVSGLDREGITVKSIGHSAESFDDDSDDEDEGMEEDDAPVKKEEKTIEIVQGNASSAIRHICCHTGGVMRTLAKAMALLTSYQRGEVKPSTVYQGPLEIGNLKIPVIAVNRMQPAKAISFKKVSPYAANPTDPATPGQVTIVDTYQTESGQQVEKADLVKGYRYGKEIVPGSTEDVAAMNAATEKCLRLMCFVPMDRIPRAQFTGDKLVSFQSRKEDATAAVALSALCRAMEEEQVYAVCRYVFRNKASPQMYAIWPHIKPDYEALLGIRLPFKEDFKEYTLPGLTTIPKLQPSTSQQASMDNFVEKMDLMTAWKDQDGDEMEALQPKETYNPVAQRIYQCIQHRALNPKDPIPELDPLLKRYVEPHKALWKAADNEGIKLSKAFPTKIIEDPKKRKSKGNWAAEDDSVSEAPNKKAKADDTVASVLSASTIVRVGDGSSVVDDYRKLCDDHATDNLIDATNQLQQLLLEKMELYLGGSTDIGPCSFIECVNIMRTKCQEADKPDPFNRFCDRLVAEVDGNPSQYEPYKNIMESNKVSRLSRVDCPSSLVAPADALLYEVKAAVAPASVVPEPEPVVEDDDLDDL